MLHPLIWKICNIADWYMLSVNLRLNNSISTICVLFSVCTKNVPFGLHGDRHKPPFITTVSIAVTIATGLGGICASHHYIYFRSKNHTCIAAPVLYRSTHSSHSITNGLTRPIKLNICKACHHKQPIGNLNTDLHAILHRAKPGPTY